MTYDNDDQTLPADAKDINTNEEYADVSTLNDIVGKDGQPLDAIEQDQVPPSEDEADSGEQLEKIAAGDEKEIDEDINDKNTYFS